MATKHAEKITLDSGLELLLDEPTGQYLPAAYVATLPAKRAELPSAPHSEIDLLALGETLERERLETAIQLAQAGRWLAWVGALLVAGLAVRFVWAVSVELNAIAAPSMARAFSLALSELAYYFTWAAGILAGLWLLWKGAVLAFGSSEPEVEYADTLDIESTKPAQPANGVNIFVNQAGQGTAQNYLQ